ncbi:hypothetical protein V512_000285 [Mesotoga sp. Brook.08.105.5.1]|jgi:hypothetical protein|nr:hypothetical protein V512_000285 [Mesotoga sp. Brook.08.105.5.1]
MGKMKKYLDDVRTFLPGTDPKKWMRFFERLKATF